jgi:hypothetical protein
VKKANIMKNLLFSVIFVLFGTFANAGYSNNEALADVTFEIEAGSCTVTYTNSRGITFSATAPTCTEAYENIMPHIEAQ